MSSGRRGAVLGTAVVASRLSISVLPHVPAVRADTLPLSHRAAVLGCRLRRAGEHRRSGRPAIRARSPVHRGSLRRLVDVPDDAAGPRRHADGWHPLPECRADPHRGRVQ